MKMRIVFVLLPLLVFLACNSGTGNRKADVTDIEKNGATPENPVPTGPLGTPEFEKTTHDFGKVVDGEQVQYKFKFKNTGKGDLTVSKVEAHCGCTTPEWTRDIIAPGGEGYILATFNSTGRGGPKGVDAEKGITVEFANSTIPSIELSLKSKIFTKE